MKVGDIISDWETGAESIATEEDVKWYNLLNARKTPFPKDCNILISIPHYIEREYQDRNWFVPNTKGEWGTLNA